MRCPRCGVGLGPEAEYCPVCGSRVAERKPYAPRHLAPSSTYGDGYEADELEAFDEFDEADEFDELLDPHGFEAAQRFDEPEPWEFEAPDEWSEDDGPHPVRRALTAVGVGLAVVLMVVLMLPMTSSPSGRAPVVFSTPAGLYPSEVTSSEVTQREVLERADELGIYPWTNWTPSFGEDGCLTDACAQQATNLLNLYRFVAGVEPVEFTTANDAKAQAVVDVYAGTEFQAHTLTERPADMDAATFAVAQEAARASNVGVGYGNWGEDLPAYIAEVDPNPIQPNYETVGHRRHLLGTSLANVGFGLNGPYSAIYIGEFDGSRVDGTVAWPACQTPTGLWVQGSPWSVSLPYAIEDDGAVSVRITRARDGRVWETDDMVHFFIDHGSYHDASAVVFTPADLLVESGDRFDVEVEGLDNGALSYSVNFFNIGFELR